MKKIVLIDDNIDGNQLKYGGAFVEEGRYADVLCYVSRLSATDDLSFVNNAACVLMHKTFDDFFDGQFHDDSHKVATLILQMPNMGSTVPFVLFSDGDTADMGDYSPESPNMIYSLSKRAFYGRLETFVTHYKESGLIDLRLLAYGRNFETVMIEQAAKSLFSSLQEYENDDVLPLGRIHPDQQRQMGLIVDMSQPKIGKSYEEIINDLQLNPITVGDFKARINRIIENFQDYGKNYYTWK